MSAVTADALAARLPELLQRGAKLAAELEVLLRCEKQGKVPSGCRTNKRAIYCDVEDLRMDTSELVGLEVVEAELVALAKKISAAKVADASKKSSSQPQPQPQPPQKKQKQQKQNLSQEKPPPQKQQQQPQKKKQQQDPEQKQKQQPKAKQEQEQKQKPETQQQKQKQAKQPQTQPQPQAAVQPKVADDAADAKRKAAEKEAIDLILRLDVLRGSLSLRSTTPRATLLQCLLGPWYLVRFVAAFVFVFLLLGPLLALVAPLRLLHSMLRWLGFRNNNLPVDLAIKSIARGFIAACGVRCVPEGIENLDVNQPTLGMFSHSSNLDPWVVQAFSPVLFRWIGKSVLFLIPVFGWLLYATGNIAIDRSNLQSAVASLDKAKRDILRSNRSVAVSPEGTRSSSGQLLDFKKGPFHLAKAVGLSVTPVVLFNAYELWPPGQMMSRSGLVVVRYLTPIIFPKDASIAQMQLMVRRAMVAALRDEPRCLLAPERYRPGTALLNFFFILFCAFATPLIWFRLWTRFIAPMLW